MKNTVYKINTRLFAGLALVALLVLPLISPVVRAQDTSGSGLRISPTRTDLSLVPGDSREVTHNITNVTQGAVSVETVLRDFESDGVTNQPQFFADDNAVSQYSLREFVEVPEGFDLEPGEEKEVTFTVSVSENAAPGAYFGSIEYRASPQGQTGDGQVALVASVGSLVLLEVPGDITEKIEITDVKAYIRSNEELKSGTIFTKKPDVIGITINNLGNGFSQPFGKVQVTDWRDNDVFEYELNDGPPRQNILPESSRRFEEDFVNVEISTVNGEQVTTESSPVTWPGRYTIKGSISHGSSGALFNVSGTFWYLPLWFIALVIGFLVALGLLVWFMYRKYITKTTKRRK